MCKWVRDQPLGFFKNKASYKEHMKLANAAFALLSKDDQKQLLADFLQPPRAPAPSRAAPQAKSPAPVPCEVPSACGYLCTWNMPEDWQSPPYQSLMRRLFQSDPESDAFSALTQEISEFPEILATELRFQSWLAVLARRHAFTEVSTSTEISLHSKTCGGYRRHAMLSTKKHGSSAAITVEGFTFKGVRPDVQACRARGRHQTRLANRGRAYCHVDKTLDDVQGLCVRTRVAHGLVAFAQIDGQGDHS